MKKKIKLLIISIAITIFIVLTILKIDNNTLAKKFMNCEKMNERLCLQADYCRANYGPSHEMTTDIGFSSCTQLADEELKKIQLDKIGCTDSGGKWLDERFIHPGRCECNYPLILENDRCVMAK